MPLTVIVTASRFISVCHRSAFRNSGISPRLSRNTSQDSCRCSEVFSKTTNTPWLRNYQFRSHSRALPKSRGSSPRLPRLARPHSLHSQTRRINLKLSIKLLKLAQKQQRNLAKLVRPVQL